MNEKEAELIGMHVGDGTLYRTHVNSIVWELRGSIHEKEYYEYVAKSIKDILNVEVKPKYRGVNSYGIQTTNKIITQFFIDSGFKLGKKVYTVCIPEYIKNSNIKVKRGFVRGLFDTDGCIRFDKNRTPFHYYPRIEFGFASKLLSEDLFLLFNDMGFRCYKWKSKRKDGIGYSIGLAGFYNLSRFMEEINPTNEKHLERIKNGLLNKDRVAIKRVSQIFKSMR